MSSVEISNSTTLVLLFIVVHKWIIWCRRFTVIVRI